MHKIQPAAIAVGSDAAIKDVIEKLNASSEKIVAMLDDNLCLLGVVTDGDVRRAILKDNNLSRPAYDIITLNPILVSDRAALHEIRGLMNNRKIEHVPVLNEEGVLLYIMRSAPELPQLDCEAIIMAGGLGKRLRPYTDKTPKPLVQVGDSTIIEGLIAHLMSFGIRKFKVSVHYLAEQVEALLENGDRFGAEIGYIREEEKLGTAGCLILLKERPKSDFIVLNGDISTKINMQEMLDAHQASGAIATVAVTTNEITIPYGVITPIKDGQISWDEKPSLSFLVSIGIYILSPKIFSYLPSQTTFVDMPELLLQAQEAGEKINIFSVYESWIDIGTPRDLVLARMLKK